MTPEQLFSQADAAGRAAVANMQIRPMVVVNPNTGEKWYEEDGVCGSSGLR